MGRFANKPDGYRCVRGQRRWYCRNCGCSVVNGRAVYDDCRKHCFGGTFMREWWRSLYEVNGGRSRRVGTARSESEWRAFLRLDGDGNDNDTTTREETT